MSAARLAALLATAALGLGACGGDDGGGSGGGGSTGGGASTAGGEQASAAQQTFSTTCGGCHTLEAAGTSGQVGPDLDDLGPNEAQVRAAIQQGPGVMPENLLEGAEADAVSKYVADSAGG